MKVPEQDRKGFGMAGWTPKTPNGIKYDGGKPPLDLIDTDFLEEIAHVLDLGAQKYELNNWKKGMAIAKVAAGVLRHVFAILRGEYIDAETGRRHSAHATCGLMFIDFYIRTGIVADDDRFGSSK